MPPSLRPENALTPRLPRREATQLGFFALLTAAALLAGSHVLNVIAAIIDIVGVLLASVAAVVAWRTTGDRNHVLLYLTAATVFGVVAVLNLLQH